VIAAGAGRDYHRSHFHLRSKAMRSLNSLLTAAAAALALAGCATQPPHDHSHPRGGPAAGGPASGGPMMGGGMGGGPMGGGMGMGGPMGRGGPGSAAFAELKPTTGSTTSGTVRFVQHGDAVMVTGRVAGLKPGQEHGFHVHEKGDCSSGDGMSAGGHFNPTNKPHGPQDSDHHVGDLPSLKADANGNAVVHFHLLGVTVGAGATDIVGRGLIVHAQPDDYKTQPTGNAGARIACAVIAKG